MTERTDQRTAAPLWASGKSPDVRGTFEGQAPPLSTTRPRLLSDRELKQYARGERHGMRRGYWIGLAIGFGAGFLGALLLIAIRAFIRGELS